MTNIGETTALIPEASAADEFSELIDGQSGDTDYPYGEFKPLATVGEVDPNTGQALTGYPDGQAAWLLDEDTVRVAYQSESYATMSNETYGWVMDSGVSFTGSHIHTIDFNRAGFADFLNNDSAASEMFEGSDHLFNTVYNVFGEIVDGKNTDSTDLSAKWGNQTRPDGNLIEFREEMQLSEGDFFFHSFCGAFYEKANKYGEGIGFEDDVWLMAEEWNIGTGMFDDPDGEGPLTGFDVANDTMGLASMVVDIANETAYTVPVLGQTGYEKLMPINSGHEDYVVVVAAGYNHGLEPAPLKIYIGKKGVDEDGNPLDENASNRDSFLGRNGLLYGQLYGIAADNATYDELGITVDADTEMMDAYMTDADAPDNFDVRYYPTSYQWDGFDSPEAVEDTEMFLWTQDGDEGEGNEQPEDAYTFFNGDSKTEHPAVDPDITKHRYVQNLTEEGGMLGIEFIDIVNELANNDADGNGLPDYLSAEATRIVPAVDGALTLETGGKGEGHVGVNNPDGSLTAATHLEEGVAKMVAPDGLQWIKTATGDVLIVDEDSGNDYGERKYALPIDPETMELAEPGTGYFLAQAGGANNLRAAAEASALGNAYSSTTSSEFSGSWNVTGLVARKEDGSFFTQEELAGTGEQEVIGNVPLSEQTLIGVVQHRGESGGAVAENKADQGGQIFMFNMEDLPEANNNNTETELSEPIFGSSESEVLEISGNNNLIFTGAGDDLIDSVLSEGDNRIYGGSGDDTFILGANDRAIGAEGDDRFFVTVGGDNSITGGAGADQFWIATAEIPQSVNAVTDFTSGEDVIGIAGLNIEFGNLTFTDISMGVSFGGMSLTQSDENTLISANGDDLAILLDVESSSLSESDFAFG